MIWFVGRRLLWSILVLWVVYTLTFALLRSAPGGPFDGERQLDPQVKAAVERKFHLDEPLARQYFRLLLDFARFEPVPCLRLPDYTVQEVIAAGLPISAALGILALSWALLLGVTVGVISAVRRGSISDVVLRTLSTAGIALPNFVVAALAILLFVFLWPLFPSGGWGTLRQLVLPAVCLGAPYAAYIARLTRSSMLDVLSADYVRTARAKGLPKRSVIFRHALRGALLPVVSFLGPATAGVLTGSLVIEQIFFVPGIGVHFVQAANQRDYTLAMGVVLLYTLVLCLMNLLVDMAYAVLDPRIEME
jgi:oligopeptide transport system permease protein